MVYLSLRKLLVCRNQLGTLASTWLDSIMTKEICANCLRLAPALLTRRWLSMGPRRISGRIREIMRRSSANTLSRCTYTCRPQHPLARHSASSVAEARSNYMSAADQDRHLSAAKRDLAAGPVRTPLPLQKYANIEQNIIAKTYPARLMAASESFRSIGSPLAPTEVTQIGKSVS